MPIEFRESPTRKQLTAVEKAMRLLARRAYSENELIRKLRSCSCYSAGEIREAVEVCRKHRFLDDELLAQDYARILNERNCGSYKIRMQLKKRGIPDALAENAVGELQELEFEAAMRAFDYKSRMLSRETDPFKKRQKIYRYLASKGFSQELICACMEQERPSAPDENIDSGLL